MKYLMIVNPKAGKRKKLENELIDLFDREGAELEIKETKKEGDGTRISKKAAGKYDVVIAAGGDGTVNEVINGLAGSDTALGIIPNGTENVLAKELKIPLEHKKSGERVLKGKERTFDLGKTNGRYFIMMSGVGLDAKASKKVRPVLKKLLGRNVYPLAAIQTYFTYTPTKLEIWLDDQVLPRWGHFAIIGNIKLYGRGLNITPMAKPNDGYLDICIFKNKDLFSMMKYLIAAKTKKKMVDLPSIEYFRVKKIKIKSKGETYVHTDAEIAGTTPAKIEIVPEAIKIIC